MTEPEPQEVAFTSSEAVELSGVTYRQLDTWVRRRLIVPSVHPGFGSGHRRRFSALDLLRLRALRLAIGGWPTHIQDLPGLAAWVNSLSATQLVAPVRWVMDDRRELAVDLSLGQDDPPGLIEAYRTGTL